MIEIHRNDYSKIPLKLKTNRVWRTYTGGKLIEQLQNILNPKDSHLPEDWIASITLARNPGFNRNENEGLSRIDIGNNDFLKDLIKDNPISFLGNDHYEKYGLETGILIKFLDSAERLTIQVHPTEERAKELFNSRFGKTEAWYVVDTRKIKEENPYVLFGFKPGITKDKWISAFNSQDIPSMINLMHKIEVNPHDLFLINGGIPHAIGPGCFIVEIQEPTDYTIRTERITPNGLKINKELLHQGLGFKKMFDCFNYQGYKINEINTNWMLKSKIITENNEYCEFSLVKEEDTSKFSMKKFEIRMKMGLECLNSFSILVVLSGEGIISIKNFEYKIKIHAGDQIFLPFNLETCEIFNMMPKKLEIIQCFPPK